MSGEPYRTGDFVWLYTPIKKVGVSPKLQKFWDGPYLVLERLSDAVYRIQRSEKSIPKVVHFDRIKKYLGPKVADWLRGNEQTQPNTLNDHLECYNLYCELNVCSLFLDEKTRAIGENSSF